MKEERVDRELVQALKIVAPGTPLREGLENILRAKTGALIVVGDSTKVMEIVEGGFEINSEFSPASLYELAKMDGAIILSSDARRILAANTQLVPDSAIPSNETGIRHRTAERVARQTGEMVISISQRRSVITIYKGNLKYVLRDISVILAKANQALQTLEKYKDVLQRALNNLSELEFKDMVTLHDVVKALQRTEMVLRVVAEIERYISELGTEGRLVKMQLEELVADIENEGLLIVRDYLHTTEKSPEEVLQTIRNWASEDLLDLALLTRALGYPGTVAALEQPVTARGYRILDKVPRLPWPVIENLVATFGHLPAIIKASIEELDEVEGIGEVRARTIQEGLKRYREQVSL